MSRLDGSGREAGDGEGTGEKDSRCSPDAAQVVAYHFAVGSWRLGRCWKRDTGQLSKGAGQASRGKRLLTVFGSRSAHTSVDIDIDNQNQYLYLISGLLVAPRHACDLAGGIGKPHLIFNSRRYCMQRDPCR